MRRRLPPSATQPMKRSLIWNPLSVSPVGALTNMASVSHNLMKDLQRIEAFIRAERDWCVKYRERCVAKGRTDDEEHLTGEIHAYNMTLAELNKLITECIPF